jgi:hypothetical protein
MEPVSEQRRIAIEGGADGWVECTYDLSSDCQRKGVYKERTDGSRTQTSILQTLVQAILDATDEDVPNLVRQIRTCDSLDDVAASILKQGQKTGEENSDEAPTRARAFRRSRRNYRARWVN